MAPRDVPHPGNGGPLRVSGLTFTLRTVIFPRGTSLSVGPAFGCMSPRRSSMMVSPPHGYFVHLRPDRSGWHGPRPKGHAASVQRSDADHWPMPDDGVGEGGVDDAVHICVAARAHGGDRRGPRPGTRAGWSVRVPVPRRYGAQGRANVGVRSAALARAKLNVGAHGARQWRIAAIAM
jgi:hypothetical protein